MRSEIWLDSAPGALRLSLKPSRKWNRFAAGLEACIVSPSRQAAMKGYDNAHCVDAPVPKAPRSSITNPAPGI